ncbi:hypothetical protein WSS_A29379 [Rhodococcus opacus M213]|uniref:DUF3263 domain-containing protein n=1 Tax=Rhodococcus opacus M213 TaxID=1129896 RepID=K8XLF3_RHOOP|nr:hypothetical protein WSS_A29379 [Rhodococcus opacus M213]
MELERQRLQPPLSTEQEDFLNFARMWAPFGGPPREELFVRFGMPPSRFVERLRQILDELGSFRTEYADLERAYPLSTRRGPG